MVKKQCVERLLHKTIYIVQLLLASSIFFKSKQFIDKNISKAKYKKYSVKANLKNLKNVQTNSNILYLRQTNQSLTRQIMYQ